MKRRICVKSMGLGAVIMLIGLAIASEPCGAHGSHLPKTRKKDGSNPQSHYFGELLAQAGTKRLDKRDFSGA